VHLIGFQNYPDLPGIYRSVSCAILPSINETWGLVVNEAMASSLPVIVSTACGCVPDLVRDGWNGLVFKAGDREKLAQALLRMSSNPEVAATMGQNSGQLIAEWSLERFSHNLWEAARLAKFRKPSPVSRALLRWMIR
jgi:glycosyltransferase involved in cell wall biosynthesis